MEAVKQTRIVNDTSPDLLDSGDPTGFQITSEYTTAFWYVLKHYGVPFQLINFIFKIYTRQKPGKVYQWTDERLANDFGVSSRNYIVSIRKNLKKWNAGEYRSGLRHFAFVSVKEHTYNARTKRQEATGYETSVEFQDIIFRIVRDARKHRDYKENWQKAIRETARTFKHDLSEFGYWNERKQKRERSLDSILGTMLLNWTGTMRRMINAAETAGFPREMVAEKLQDIFPAALHAAVNESLVIGPRVTRGETLETSASVPIRASRADFKLLWAKVESYVAEKSAELPEVLPKDYRTNEAGHNDTNNSRERWGEHVRNRFAWTGPTPGPRFDSILEYPAPLQSGGEIQAAGIPQGNERKSLDRERLRFMEKISGASKPAGR